MQMSTATRCCRALAATAVVAAVSVACTSPGEACTSIGADHGVQVVVDGPGALALNETEITVQSCAVSTGCELNTGILIAGGSAVDQGCTDQVCSATPVPDGTQIAFVPFRHQLDEKWSVTVWLGAKDDSPDLGPVTQDGRIVTPNGAKCEPRVSQTQVRVTVP